MQTETGIQRAGGAGVTARAAALVAVGEVPRRAVVAGGDDAVVADEDGADAAFHAVGAGGGEGAELHEVFVPGWAEAGGGGEVERLEVGVEGGEGGEGVEDAEVGAVEEGG